MSHTIIRCPIGWIVASVLGGIVLDASLCDTYGEALASVLELQGAL